MVLSAVSNPFTDPGRERRQGSYMSSQLRLARLTPEVLKRLTCGREVSSLSLFDLCFLVGEPWREQVVQAL